MVLETDEYQIVQKDVLEGLPDHRSPGSCEPEDEEGSHHNQRRRCRLGALWVVSIKGEVTCGC